MAKRCEPGGVILKIATPASIAKEVMHFARRFGAQLDNSGRTGTLTRIVDGVIIQAKKVSPGGVTKVTLFTPDGAWLFGAFSFPGTPEQIVSGVNPTALSESRGWPLMKAVGYRMPGGFAYSAPEDWEANDAEFDPNEKLKFFPKTGYIQDELQNFDNKELMLQPALEVSKYHLTSSEVFQAYLGPGTLRSNIIDINVHATGAPQLYAKNPDFPGKDVAISPITLARVIVQPNNIRDFFDGANSISRTVYQSTDGKYAVNTGAHEYPPSAFVFRGKDGKYDVLAFVTPLEWSSSGTIRAFKVMADNAAAFAQYKVYPTIPPDAGIELGHGVATISIKFTPEQLKQNADGKTEFSLSERLLGSTAVRGSEYGLRHSKEFYTAYFERIDDVEYDEDSDTWNISETTLIPVNSECTEPSNLLSFGTAARQGLTGPEPTTPRALAPGELPDYYGPAQVMVGTQLIETYADPPIPERYLVPEDPEDAPPTYQYRAATCAAITVHTISEDGASVSSSVHRLDENDYLVEWRNWPVTDPPSEPPTVGRMPDTMNKYLFYASSGPALPCVIVPIKPNVQLPPLVTPPPEPPPNFSYFNSAPSDGQQDTRGIKFALFFFQGNGGIRRVDYDLNGYQPPRPTMFGTCVMSNFHCAAAAFPLDQFWYNRPGALNPSTTYSSHTHVMSPPNGTTVADTIDAGKMLATFASDYPGDGPDLKSPKSAWYEFTQRRTSSQKTGLRHIHAHLGGGQVAVIASENASATNTKDITWSLVVCSESTGEFVEVRGDLPPPPGEKYPLESSGWLNINLISPQTRNAETGEVGQEAVLVLTVSKPDDVVPSDGQLIPGFSALGHADPQLVGPNNRWGLLRDNTTVTRRLYERADYSPTNAIVNGNIYKFISYDGGRTWEPFVNQIPGDVYYIGNLLQNYRNFQP